MLGSFRALSAVGVAGAAVIAALQRRGALDESSSRTTAPRERSARTATDAAEAGS
jgi:hypothetical protein